MPAISKAHVRFPGVMAWKSLLTKLTQVFSAEILPGSFRIAGMARSYRLIQALLEAANGDCHCHDDKSAQDHHFAR